MSLPADAVLATALRIVDDAWAEVQRGPYVQVRLGVVPTRLPDLSFAQAERRSAVGQSLLKRLAALDTSALPHELALWHIEHETERLAANAQAPRDHRGMQS